MGCLPLPSEGQGAMVEGVVRIGWLQISSEIEEHLALTACSMTSKWETIHLVKKIAIPRMKILLGCSGQLCGPGTSHRRRSCRGPNRSRDNPTRHLLGMCVSHGKPPGNEAILGAVYSGTVMTDGVRD